MPLTTKWLSNRASETLRFLSDHGFRYYRSFEHFRRSDSEGLSYITINPVTHNRVFYHLAFYLAVRNDPIESTIKQIVGAPTKLNHYDRSVWNYTVNIGPTSPHWNYPIPGTWSFQTERDFDSSEREIVRFVTGLALPFLSENLSKAAIRRTLLKLPGHAQNLKPYQQIFAVDILSSDVSSFEADYSLLTARYKKFHRPFQDEFCEFYRRASQLIHHQVA